MTYRKYNTRTKMLHNIIVMISTVRNGSFDCATKQNRLNMTVLLGIE